jgi:hypothetical protein
MRIQVRVLRNEPKTMRIWVRIRWVSGVAWFAGSACIFPLIACLVRRRPAEALLPAETNANLLERPVSRLIAAKPGLTEREPILGKVRLDANEARMVASGMNLTFESGAPGAECR